MTETEAKAIVMALTEQEKESLRVLLEAITKERGTPK